MTEHERLIFMLKDLVVDLNKAMLGLAGVSLTIQEYLKYDEKKGENNV